jgi:uncharacterized protein DUF2786
LGYTQRTIQQSKKEENNVTPNEAIIEKIKKLLNMTSDRGCSEDEAETALRMASGLMARHGIEQASLTANSVKNLAKIGKRISREFKKYQLVTAQAAAELYGCTIVWYSSGKYGLEFVGRPDNTVAAESTMFWLMSQIERFYKESLPRGLTQSDRANYRKTFKEACALRVSSRVHRMMADMTRNNQSAQASTGQNALVVSGYFERLHKENKELLQSEYAGRLKQSKPMRFSAGSGTAAGQAAGDRVQLRRELN